MTLKQVADAAGVSAATVSRVMNSAGGIAPATADAVHRAIAAMSYAPTRRRRAVAASKVSGRRVAFMVMQTNRGVTPAYDGLLRGISGACNQLNLDLRVGFIDDPEEAIDRLIQQRHEGLLLHGTCPPVHRTLPLHGVPTVWLMGNRFRPSWGDQVMPDNTAIGQIAAQYLLRRGHRTAFYFGINSGWSLGVRSLAFADAMEDAGAVATIVNPAGPKTRGVLHSDQDDAIRELVRQLLAHPKRPMGLFVAEDWLLRAVYAAVEDAGIVPGRDLDIISCNNDRPHLLGLNPMPATIDIRFDRIGFRAVERLVSRLQGQDLSDRIRMMIEPVLVLPTADVPAHSA